MPNEEETDAENEGYRLTLYAREVVTRDGPLKANQATTKSPHSDEDAAISLWSAI